MTPTTVLQRRFCMGDYNLHVELGEGHHQWCFFGTKHTHGSEYAWPKSTPARFPIRPVTAIDQIAWGSWDTVMARTGKGEHLSLDDLAAQRRCRRFLSLLEC